MKRFVEVDGVDKVRRIDAARFKSPGQHESKASSVSVCKSTLSTR